MMLDYKNAPGARSCPIEEGHDYVSDEASRALLVTTAQLTLQ